MLLRRYRVSWVGPTYAPDGVTPWNPSASLPTEVIADGRSNALRVLAEAIDDHSLIVPGTVSIAYVGLAEVQEGVTRWS